MLCTNLTTWLLLMCLMSCNGHLDVGTSSKRQIDAANSCMLPLGVVRGRTSARWPSRLAACTCVTNMLLRHAEPNVAAGASTCYASCSRGPHGSKLGRLQRRSAQWRPAPHACARKSICTRATHADGCIEWRSQRQAAHGAAQPPGVGKGLQALSSVCLLQSVCARIPRNVTPVSKPQAQSTTPNPRSASHSHREEARAASKLKAGQLSHVSSRWYAAAALGESTAQQAQCAPGCLLAGACARLHLPLNATFAIPATTPARCARPSQHSPACVSHGPCHRPVYPHAGGQWLPLLNTLPPALTGIQGVVPCKPVACPYKGVTQPCMPRRRFATCAPTEARAPTGTCDQAICSLAQGTTAHTCARALSRRWLGGNVGPSRLPAPRRVVPQPCSQP
jgi:hypothetical protein